ncbi:hypothetical protein CGRA01v4_10134 [Colletotrichum graminicola]|nr:hypothetical protein CGRA01v4_10134 [Colletotrichum graminicola]
MQSVVSGFVFVLSSFSSLFPCLRGKGKRASIYIRAASY